MNENEQIKQLLIELENDKTKILELEKYDIKKIINIALREKLYNSLIILFKPITIDGNVKIYFDAFSHHIVPDIIDDLVEEKENLLDRYEEYKKQLVFPEDAMTYDEFLEGLIIVPKGIKEKLKKEIFTIDYNLINQIKIKDSHARQIAGWSHPIKTKEDVIYYSEPACLAASIDLFNKNIKTTCNDTDCVIEDSTIENGICSIWFEYETLSDENKHIVEELIEKGNAKRFMDSNIETVSIFVPCSSEETVGEVSNKLQDITSKLKHQDILEGKYTLEEIVEYYNTEYPGIFDEIVDNGEIIFEDLIEFIKLQGLYYDEEEDIVWENKNLYDRHKKYIDLTIQNNNQK